MFVAHLGLVALILAVIMLPRAFAIHFNNENNPSREEYDYR